MKQKQIFIILGAAGIIFLLFWLAVITLVVKNIRGATSETSDPIVVDVTLCDEDASDLCIVTFGANNLNRMVIYFQLPNAGYAPFYVKADNRGTVSVYSCEVDKVATATTHAYCTGVRTPLGETIDIEVYTTDEDKLIARGTFLVSAIALATPISLPSEIPTEAPAQPEAPVATEAPITEVPITEVPIP